MALGVLIRDKTSRIDIHVVVAASLTVEIWLARAVPWP